ncbi:MAG: hypothetical protein ACI4ED_05865 [Suilimivivens sp.]
MGLIQKFLNWKKNREDPIYEVEDWNEVIYDRDDLQINDKQQREEYIRGCLEQIAEASRELENLQHEYNMVTSYLKDMEEIEALPEEEKTILQGYARKLDELEVQQSGYLKRENRMSDSKFRQLERMETEIQEGCDKLVKTEEYQDLIKRDLRRLDGEKQAYVFRKNELRRTIEDSRSMAIVCTTAVVVCILLLFLMQFGLHMNTRMGYFAAAALGAAAITAIFLKHNNAEKELQRVENSIGRIIRLQNTVKIRYVNNTHLLDYLYLKYNVSSAGELQKSWQQYQQEKEERERYYKAEKALDECQKDLLHELRRYQIQDPMIWLHQTAALLDRKEMVEIRHNLIIRRQSLRRRMDYNKEVIAGNAQAEIKDLAEKYPKYAREIMDIVGQYEKDFS